MKNKNYVSTYLINRLESIFKEKMILSAQISKNNIEILELNNKIVEIKDKIDEAYEIFSPNPVTSHFNKTEMAVLAEKQNDLREKNNTLCKQTEELEIEEKQVKECIILIENGIVLAKNLNETKCAERFCADISARVEIAGEELKDDLEKIRNTRNTKIIDNMLEKYVSTFEEIEVAEFVTKLDNSLRILNQKYDDRIGVFYEGLATKLSKFIVNIAYKLIVEVLEEVLMEYIDNQIILKITIQDNIIILDLKINDGNNIDFESILYKNIGIGDSNLTYMDLLNICNGGYVNLNIDKRKEIVIKIK